MRKIDNEIRRTQNELTISEFVPVRTISFIISILFLIFLLPSVSSGNWQNYGGDLTHSGYSESAPIPLELRWKYQVGGEEISAPIIDEGILFVGSDDNDLYAIDAVKGELKWRYSTQGKVYTPTAKNGIVYAPSVDNNIYAIDRDGNLKWQSNVGSSMTSPPVVYNNILFGGSGQDIYAIHIINGSENWRYATGESIESSPAISQGIVFVGSNDHNLYALDAGNKNPRWIYTAGGSITSSPAVINGIVIVGANDNIVHAINSNNGLLKWQRKINDIVKSTPSVFQNTVYIGSYDNKIYALNMDNGDIIWDFPTSGWVDSQPIVTKNIIYAGSNDGTIYALDRVKGELAGSYVVGNAIISLALSDNMLYATSKDGYVYAFGKDVPEATTSPRVVQDLIPPELKINPIPINVTSEKLTVSGTARDSSGVIVVTVNGIEAGADNWETTLNLSSGTNIISIMAVDKAGNIKTEVHLVRYIPPVIQETPIEQTPGFSVYVFLVPLIIIIFFYNIKKYNYNK